jgi:hypothetical protein
MSLIINYVAGSFFFTVQVIPACENKDLSQTPAKETQVVTAHTHDVQNRCGRTKQNTFFCGTRGCEARRRHESATNRDTETEIQ